MLRLSAVLLLALCLAAQPVAAHKLLLMAWVQGDQLMGEVAFGDGKFATNAHVSVLDQTTGDQLLSAQTNAQGVFAIPLPQEVLDKGQPLLIRVDDGAGHLAEQILDATELDLARPASTAGAGMGSGSADFHESTDHANHKLLQNMVQEAVRQEVAPLRRDLMALARSGPGVTEILGGIGYIIGLASLGVWLLRKR